MTKLKKFSLALPALLLALSTMASARDARVGDLPSRPADLSMAGPGCTGGCINCSLGYFGIVDLGAPNKYWAYEYDCTGVACPNGCLQTLANGEPLPAADLVAQKVAAAIHAGDYDAVKQLMEEDTRIELNASRGVLQVVGCDDAIVATVGMPMGSLSVLTVD